MTFDFILTQPPLAKGFFIILWLYIYEYWFCVKLVLYFFKKRLFMLFDLINCFYINQWCCMIFSYKIYWAYLFQICVIIWVILVYLILWVMLLVFLIVFTVYMIKCLGATDKDLSDFLGFVVEFVYDMRYNVNIIGWMVSSPVC